MIRSIAREPYTGITERSGKYIPTGLPTIDNSLNDLAPGCVTVIVGRANGGKTTFVKQITANAISNGNSVFLVNGENDEEIWLNELYQCVIGRDNKLYNVKKINKRYHKEPKPETLELLKQWQGDRLAILSTSKEGLLDIDGLFKKIDAWVYMNDTGLVIIDNLMSVLNAKSNEKNEKQAEFVQKCCDIAKRNRCHIVIVVHPNKEYRKGMEMDFENISGTSDIPNKADNVIAVIREYDQIKIDNGINGKIAILKNKYYSDIKCCSTHFDTETGLLCEIAENGDVIHYNFRLESHITADPEIYLPFDL